MTYSEPEEDRLVAQHLGLLRSNPPRSDQKARSGRAKFLAQARALAGKDAVHQPVSETPVRRLNGWVVTITQLFNRKERFRMFASISTIIIAATMLFGGAGATVYAAQDSLPNDVLYPIKTFGENVRLALASNTQSRLQLVLRFCDQRVAEIAGVAGQGEPLWEDMITRLQEQQNLALQAAAELDDPAMIGALQQIKLRLRLQEQRLMTVQSSRPEITDGMLERIKEMLRQQLRQIDADLQDPAAFRLRFQKRLRPGKPAGATPQETQTLGAPGYGPGSGDGSGYQDCPQCTPALDGSGPGPGPQYGGRTDQPTQDAGQGPGPISTPKCDICTPVQDGTGPGPGLGHQGGAEQPTDEPGAGSSPSSPPSQDTGSQGPGSQNPAENPPDDSGSGGSGGNGSGNGNGGGGSNRP